jgi:predicted molibdopterin-dependent oxidoreductase YjgC
VTDHLSFCRICAAACGIVVSVDEGQVVKVRGDAEHPVSRGYTCEKGRALPQWHHSPNRLDHPRLRGTTAGWDEVLDDLANIIDETKSIDGADSIGLYLATGLAYDSAGQVSCGMWMGSVGSTSFYTAATVDNAPVLVAAEAVAGHPMLNPVWEPEHSRLLILLATNPVVSHGYGTTLADPVRRLRENQALGGKVWTIDPRRTESAALSDNHLQVRPGSDVILLAALVRELFADERCRDSLASTCHDVDIDRLARAVLPFSLDAAEIATGCSRESIDELVAQLRSAFGRVAMFCGTGTTMATDGILVEWLRWVLLAMTNSLDVRGGMRFNEGVVNRLAPVRPGTPALDGPSSRPELVRIAGQLPVAALVDEIEAGRLKVLVVTGGNPLSAFPEPDRFRQAAALLDALVVIDALGDGEWLVVGLVDGARADRPLNTPGAGDSWKPWFPVIDPVRCTNCMQCLSFCLFDVYGVDADHRLRVENPSNCKVNCPACSRVCPEVAIMFPKYHAGPIDGAPVSQTDVGREKMKIDISALLGGDLYARLRERSAEAKNRFSRERSADQALAERRRCLTKLADAAAIPREVLDALPSPEEIQRKSAEAAKRAAAALAGQAAAEGMGPAASSPST